MKFFTLGAIGAFLSAATAPSILAQHLSGPLPLQINVTVPGPVVLAFCPLGICCPNPGPVTKHVAFVPATSVHVTFTTPVVPADCGCWFPLASVQEYSVREPAIATTNTPAPNIIPVTVSTFIDSSLARHPIMVLLSYRTGGPFKPGFGLSGE